MDTQPIRTSEESMREMSRLPLIVGISVGVGATLVLLIAIVSCIALRMKRGRRRPAPSVMQVEEGTLETPTRPNLSATVRASEDAGIRRSTDERSSVRRNRLKRPAPTGAQMKPIRSPTTGTFPQTRPRADSTNRSATTVAAAVTAAAVATMMATRDTGNAQMDPAAASASAQQQQRERPKQPQYLHQHNNQPEPSRQPRRRPRSPESSRTPRQNQNQNQNQNQSGGSSPTGERATWPNISSTVILASERRNNDDDNNNSNNNNRSYSYYPSFPASPPSSRPVTSDQRRPSTSGKASISHGTSRTLSPVPSFFYSATANGADDSQQGEGGEDVDLASPRPSSDLDHSPLDDLGFGSRATTAMARSPRSDILFAQSSGYNRIDREINLSPPSQVAASIGFGTQAQLQRSPSRQRPLQQEQEQQRDEMRAFASSPSSSSPPSSFTFPLPPPPAAVVRDTRRQSARVGDALLAALESTDPVIVASGTGRPILSISSRQSSRQSAASASTVTMDWFTAS